MIYGGSLTRKGKKASLGAALFFLLLIGCRAPSAAPPGRLEIHYAPKENLESLDSKLLRSAQTSIDMCAYTFTDHAVADALIFAAARGVRVRIYLNQGQAHRTDETEEEEPEYRGVLDRLSTTRNVEIRIKHSHTLMHLKSYLVDGKVLRLGSANFSPGGEKRQDNDLLLTTDPEAIERFRQNFAVLWTRPDNQVATASMP